jgi:lysophospholipid acyltransferase (LPLAT)-like uncharacterized protein
MKKLFKNFYQSQFLAWITHKLICFLVKTNRREVIGWEAVEKTIESGKPTIIAFWHGRLLPMPLMLNRVDNTAVIISRHSDGEFIANVAKKFKAKTIRGSSNRRKDGGVTAKDRGGVAVVRETIAALEEGYHVVITPDGPKGPRMHVKDNIFRIAQKTGAPIIVSSFSATNSIVFKSWDRFMLPLPFGKIVLKIEGPFYIDKGATEEEVKSTGKMVENTLNKITEDVDVMCNKPIITPE